MTWAARNVLVLLLAASVGSSSARATTLQHLDTRTLTRASDAIVIARVERVESSWDPGHRRIFTRTTVAVDEQLKGAAAATIVLTQLGGEVDGVKVSVPGCPVFTPGERALIFVSKTGASVLQVTGLAQGKFEIERDSANGETFARRRAPGFATSDVQTLHEPTSRRLHGRVRLTDLLAEIRRNLETER